MISTFYLNLIKYISLDIIALEKGLWMYVAYMKLSIYGKNTMDVAQCTFSM
jgi:hypothetical protein